MCLQGTCDNSSYENKASMMYDSMTRHLENEEEYLRVTEVDFFVLYIWLLENGNYCKIM